MKMPPNFLRARVTSVIEVCTLEGAGVESDPIREVFYYLESSGAILAVHDPLGKVTLNNQHKLEVERPTR